jgi:biopolymer transport protein TolR
VSYAVVAQVMGALSAGGFTRIGLVTDPGGPSLDAPAAPARDPAAGP